MEYEYIKVTNVEPYEMLYHYLRRNGYSKNYLKKLTIKPEFITLNNQPATFKSFVHVSDIIAINKHPIPTNSIISNIIPLNIVYEDGLFLIVNKQPGMVTTPTRSHLKDSLAGSAIKYLNSKGSESTIRILNRLDKDTSGLVIFAKTAQAQNYLVKKTYHAICSGLIEKDIIINSPIKTIIHNGINQRKRIVSPDGKNATTYVKPLKQFKDATLVEVKLDQGRTHQIRVHLSSVMHPLIGDELYGEKSNIILHSALICKEIKITNKDNKYDIHLQIPYDKSFKILINSLS